MARNSLIPSGFGGFEPITSLHREMNRLFDEAFRGFGSRGLSQEQGGAMPSLINASMNVSETENEYRVSVELPGVTEQDIDVTLNDDLLTIRGEKKFESERGGDKENFHFVERSYGTFQRSLRLPFSADPDQVKASFRNGVLTVQVPKGAAQQERARRIQIEASSSQGGQEQEQDASAQQGRRAQTNVSQGSTGASESPRH